MIKHLKIAAQYANKENKNIVYVYFWHLVLSLGQAMFLFILSLLSVVHAVFPFLLDFQLLQWRIDELRNLKNTLPNDPLLDKVEFKE
jgi:hypothetical protein